MSLIDSFMGGYRGTHDLMSYLTQGSKTGRGLIRTSENFIGPPNGQVGVIRHHYSSQSAVRALIKHIAEQDKDGSKLENLSVTKCRAFYAPVHIFVSEYCADWSAAIGYDRTERYNDRGATKSHLVTEWHPTKERQSGQACSFAYAGSQRVSEIESWSSLAETLTKIETVDIAELSDLDLESGFDFETAFQRGGRAGLDMQVQQDVYDQMVGDRARDCQWSYHAEISHMMVYIPLFEVTFKIQENSVACTLDGWALTNFAHDSLPKVEKPKTAADLEQEKKDSRIAFVVLALAVVGGYLGESWLLGIGIFIGAFVCMGIYQSITDPSAVKRPTKQKKDDVLSRLLIDAERFA